MREADDAPSSCLVLGVSGIEPNKRAEELRLE